MRGEQLDQIVVVATQVGAATQSQTCRIGLEQMSCIGGDQPDITQGVESQCRNDAQTKTEADIGFYYIRIKSGQCDIGLNADPLEGRIDPRAAGKSRVIGNHGPARLSVQ